MSRPRKKRHISLGKLQFSPIILSFQPLKTGGKSPYFSLRDSNGKRIGSRIGPATFLNYSKHFSTFSYQFLLFLWSYLVFSPLFREKRENEIWKKKEPYRASQSLIEASFDSSYDTRKDEMEARSQKELCPNGCWLIVWPLMRAALILNFARELPCRWTGS